MNSMCVTVSRSYILIPILGAVLFSPYAAEGIGGFDTSTSHISRAQIRSGGPGKDGIPALTHPRFVPASWAGYLRPSDLVIGVHLNGKTKAYPLRILIWHENANDVVGGQPVAVTYCPLCQSALVFDRRIGGTVREFGVSGLLYNSNVLLYDRQPRSNRESLWSQIEMRAVTGPAAKEGLTMKLLPSELVPWQDWLTRFPETEVLSEETGHHRNYRGTAYASYFASDQLMFTVKKKIKRPKRFKNKELLILVYADEDAKAYSVRDVAKVSGKGGELVDQIGDRKIRLTYLNVGPSVRVEAVDGGRPLPVAYMFWFALSAMQPELPIFNIDP